MILGYAKKFDFDSVEPIQAEDFHENVVLRDIQMWAIEWLMVVNVLAGGAFAIKWWVYSGYDMLMRVFSDHLPWVMRLATTGQI